MSLLKVINFVKEKHKNQVDISGQPYFLHLQRVSKKLKITPYKEIAYLHDIFEDTNTYDFELSYLGVAKWQIDIIKILTKRKDELYEDYILRLAKDPIARIIKIADLEDNMDVTRLKVLDEINIQRLKKYHKAYTYLKTIK
jgi:(p)ppGpp synthase/HD superfamily hydrolase